MIQRIAPVNVSNGPAFTCVDVREFPEFAAASIAGAQLVPLSTLAGAALSWSRSERYLLICKSGARAQKAAATLDQMNFSSLFVLDGGMDAWKQAGLPYETAQSKPWSLERQVRTIAGGMVVVWTVLGITVSQWFLAGSLFFGAGLFFAGVTDLCLMATLLGKLPWNQSKSRNALANS